MFLRGCATNTASPAPTEIVAAPNVTETLASSPPSTEATLVVEVTETPTPSLVPTAIEPTKPPITTTPITTPTAATTEPPATTLEQATPTQAQNATCNTSVPSRLSVGQTAQVVRRLNMRSDASIDAPITQTNPINTQVEIIGGAVCTPVGDHAYLWWQIRLANGAEGWSAESPLDQASYFLEPIP